MARLLKVGQKNYHAAVCTQFGKPLQVQEFPDTDIKKLRGNEVVLSIESCGINYADILLCKGLYQHKLMPPFTPGFDIAGKVLATGPDVSRVKTNDRVVAFQPTAGGFGQQHVFKDEDLYTLPDHVTCDTAASMVCSYGTALLALERTARLQNSADSDFEERVLVTGAAGATGLAAMDLALNVFGAKVIGACGSQTKCELLQSMGFEHTIDYSSENVRTKLKELTGGKGPTLVFDTVGGDLFLDCLKSLAHEGRILTIGYSSGKIPSIPANLILVKSITAAGVVWGDYQAKKPDIFRKTIMDCLGYAADEKITPHFSASYPLDKVNEAFKSILERKTTGKVLIKPYS